MTALFVVSFSLYSLGFYYFADHIKSAKSKENEASKRRPTDVPMEVFELSSHYNWDFRKIPIWLLKYTLRFEYLRSWEEFHAAAVVWLEKKIEGQTIRDLIIYARLKKELSFPETVWKELPKDWMYHFEVLWENPLYPVPTAWMVEQGRFQPSTLSEMQKKRRLRQMVNVRPLHKDYIEHLLKSASIHGSSELNGYHVKIDFERYKNEELVNAFRSWLKDESKRVRKVPIHGRASAPRWHRLKQLAARRLAKLGLSYKDALQTIAERERVAPLPADLHGVLPKYNSHGAWHDAIKEASQFIEKMKANFHLEDWELL